MIPRYSHPVVAELWSDRWTYSAWLTIEQTVLVAQRERGLVPKDETDVLAAWFDQCHVGDSSVEWIQKLERNLTHHDVAAFLYYWRDARRDADAKWIHYGLTSSDLVDTAQAMRFKSMYPVYTDAVRRMMLAIARWTEVDQPMLGSTHGQPGEPTSIRARAHGWLAEVEEPLYLVQRQTRAMQRMKLSGPMGTFAHNPPELEAEVAVALRLIPMGAGATQIVPRSTLAVWASSCSALLAAYHKIAHDLRLLAAAGEVTWKREDGHVGSSAMPHKNNPVEAEQIGGLARLARGYAAALEEAPLWLERDISNSSVERVAVPDLWHVVMRATKQMEWLLADMELRADNIEIDLALSANDAWSHRTRLAEIADGATFDDATDIALGNQVESYDILGDARWFTRQYPKGRQV